MEELFDKRKIASNNVYTESYVGYGKNDLSKMTKKDLQNELKRVEEDINTLKSEIDDADSYPSYALKERLENSNWYKNKVQKEIEKRELNKETDSSETLNKPKNMRDMIKDLERQYEKGYITKSYRDKYINKLENSIKAYEESIEQERAKEEERQKKENSKRHIFKTFKKKLNEYKK